MKLNPLLESKRVLEQAAEFSKDYLQNISARRVQPNADDKAGLITLSTAFPEFGCDPMDTLQLLHDIGSKATVATTGGRYHGLVVGGSLPATVGARVLNAAWDQLVLSEDTSPIAVHLEKVVANWLRELFMLSPTSSVGFVTGTTMGNFTCLAAARHRILSRHGWDVEKQGLNGAPRIRIVASEEIHVTVKKVIAMLGLGIENMELVPCDNNGVMKVDEMPSLDADTIVLAQAGNVNSGAVDRIAEIAEISAASNAWFHLDGAFGLWAAASKSKRHLLAGLEQVNSCVTDGHKWLNTPYDCGVAMCADPEAMHSAMSTVAPYFSKDSDIPPKDMVPELSRSARSLDMWAAMHSLGRNGIEALIDRCCRHAVLAGKLLEEHGFEVLNDVVLNQLVVTHPQNEHRLQEMTNRVCATGETWFGATHWQGRCGFRMSFSSWVTSDDDVKRSVKAIIKEAKKMGIID
jgi:glutamate/tyrosine decarboxylase-like PLP-dependent enzyme